jgi:hypothetical protein
MITRILDRYARDENGRLVLEISAGSVQELYNHFDRHAPYIKKELDPELIEYIIESVREIGPAPFVIRFCLGEHAGPELQSRVRTSIGNYFLYLAELGGRELRQKMTHAILFLTAGIGAHPGRGPYGRIVGRIMGGARHCPDQLGALASHNQDRTACRYCVCAIYWPQRRNFLSGVFRPRPLIRTEA